MISNILTRKWELMSLTIFILVTTTSSIYFNLEYVYHLFVFIFIAIPFSFQKFDIDSDQFDNKLISSVLFFERNFKYFFFSRCFIFLFFIRNSSNEVNLTYLTADALFFLFISVLFFGILVRFSEGNTFSSKKIDQFFTSHKYQFLILSIIIPSLVIVIIGVNAKWKIAERITEPIQENK